jgi:hypothetical protein
MLGFIKMRGKITLLASFLLCTPVAAQLGQPPLVTAVGMTPYNLSAVDNSPLVQKLMNAISPSATANVNTNQSVTFPGLFNTNNTTEYYFSGPISLSRNVRIVCGGGGVHTSREAGVKLVVPAGIDGVVFEDSGTSADGGTGGGTIENCGILSLGYGLGIITAGSSSVTGAGIGQIADTMTSPGWAVNDGFIAASPHQDNTIGIDVTQGAYVSRVSGSGLSNSTLTLATGFQSYYTNASQISIYRLPAALTYNVTTTIGSNKVMVTSGPSCLRDGDVIWSDAFPFGATIRGWTGSCTTTSSTQTLSIYDNFMGAVLNATVAHNGSTPGIGPNLIGNGTSYATSAYGGGSYPPMPASAAIYNGAYYPNGWASGGALPINLIYDFGSGQAQAATLYTLWRKDPYGIFDNKDSPAQWSLYGSKDATTCTTPTYGSPVWTLLDTETAQVLSQTAPNPTAYTISSPGAYRCYILHIITNGGGGWTSIYQMTLNVPSTATGKLWRVPACIKHRTTSVAKDDVCSGFPLGVQLSCSTGGKALNCTDSIDASNTLKNGLIGRWQSGNNSGASLSSANNYHNNAVYDIFDGGSVPSMYFGEMSNSGGTGAIVGNCVNGGGSFFGTYIEARGPWNYCVTSQVYAYNAFLPTFFGSLTVSPQDAYQVNGASFTLGAGGANWNSSYSAKSTMPGTKSPTVQGDFVFDQSVAAGAAIGWGNSGTGGAWTPLAAGLYANNSAGTDWTLGNYEQLTAVAIGSLKACNASSVGTIAMVNNGVASPTYNGAVSTTGSAIEPVACTYNGSAYAWTYH